MSRPDTAVSRPKRRRPAPSRPGQHGLADRDWLNQFTPVDEAGLSERQRRFAASMRKQYPNGRAGRWANGELCFFGCDDASGRFAGLLLDRP